MPAFPIPANERERLREVRRLRFDEWDALTALDDLCAVAAATLNTPIAGISLVDGDEQIFAGKKGLDADRIARAIGFCAHAIMTPEPLIVEDATCDRRFFQNPLVTGGPKVRAYLGIPLETAPGLRVGALCAVDGKPRAFAESDVQSLARLARIAESLLMKFRAMIDHRRQMTSAIALQNAMLPKQTCIEQVQTACPLEVESWYKALDGVGGDIWGMEATRPHRLMLYIADFTGHGIAAALNTARFHSFVHIACQRTDKPASVLRRLNQRLNEVLPVGQFATMFCAALDFGAKTLEYASAGAPPQLYRRSSAERFEVLSKPGLPLGVLRDASYESETLPFEPGGALVLYTDGLIETPRHPKPIFTPGALSELLNAFPRDSAAGMRQRIAAALFSDGEALLEDDLTLVAARHTGEEADWLLDYDI
jgi:serine phosphatase RsbU (regulator of sigma subunit)